MVSNAPIPYSMWLEVTMVGNQAAIVLDIQKKVISELAINRINDELLK